MTKPILNAPAPNAAKLEVLRQHFPQAIETDSQGRVRINAAALQLALDPSNPAGVQVEEDGFELRWVGKREAYHSAFVPVQKIIEPRPEQCKKTPMTAQFQYTTPAHQTAVVQSTSDVFADVRFVAPAKVHCNKRQEVRRGLEGAARVATDKRTDSLPDKINGEALAQLISSIN